MNDPYYIGVDLGGTQLRLAAVTREGSLATGILSVPTGPAFTPRELCRQLGQLIAQLQDLTGRGDFHALGMGITGIVREARLQQSDFLPLLDDLEIPNLVSSVTNCPVVIENDARCFVLAEARFGAGRGARNLCGITLGTGVGGGVIVDGKLVCGVSAQAGEIWSIPLRDKHLEYFLSGAGVVRGYIAAGGAARDADGREVDSARIAELARQGDAAACAAWASFGEDLYTLCQTIIALLDPEVIVIGGSLGKARDLYFAEVMKKLGNPATRLAFAELGDAAGLIGAASLNIPWL